jgi:nitrogen fixation NifU-like protein
MFEELADLYSDTIRGRSRHPLHGARPEGAQHEARGDNPMCGDRVKVFARMEGGHVAAVGFEARGCDITTASADLMCEAVAGHDPAAIRAMAGQVAAMARTGTCPDCGPALDKLRPLSAVHDYPSRVRCVTLPWDALLAALDTKETAHV